MFIIKIRVVKTASKTVKVLRYKNNNRIIVQHLGSAHSEEELNELILIAEEWIKDFSNQLSIFPDEHRSNLLHLNHCTFLGIKYHFFNHLINIIRDKSGFSDLPLLLKDLVTITIFEPASKLRSL